MAACLIETSSKHDEKMTPDWEPRGGPTNHFFAHWTPLGATLALKGAPKRPRGAPETLRSRNKPKMKLKTIPN